MLFSAPFSASLFERSARRTVTAFLLRVLFVVIAAIGATGSANAATCTSKASGNWNNTTTWGGCGTMSPGTLDTAVISSHSVVLNVTTTVASVTLSSVTFNGGLMQLSTAALTITGGLFFNQPSSNTFSNGLIINAATVTVGGSVIFFSTAAGLPRMSSITITSGLLDIGGSLIFNSSAPSNKIIQMSGVVGQIRLQGALTNSAGARLAASGTDNFTFTGNSAQVVGSSWGTGGYNNLTILATSGNPTKTFAPGIVRVNDLVLGDGTAVIVTAATNNTILIATGSVSVFSNATFSKSSSSFTFSPNGTQTWTDINGTKQDMGWVKIENGSGAARVNAGGVLVSSISIGAGQTLGLTSFMRVTSHWINSGTFIHNNNIVNFSGASSQTVFQRGQAFAEVVSSNVAAIGLVFSSSFSAAALTLNAGTLGSSATMYFSSLSTYTISTFTVVGSAGKYVVLKSTASAPWYLNNSQVVSASYVQVSSCNASAGHTIYCDNCVDGGNNTNWNFNTPTLFTWTGAIDNDFQKPGNWDRSAVPRAVDPILIPNTANKPQLTADVTVATMTIQSGGIVTLSSVTPLTLRCGLTTASGSSFVMGANNTLILINDSTLAPGTFTRGTGTAVVKLNGNINLNSADQNLGEVVTGP